mgnify:CR=1 FL=1
MSEKLTLIVSPASGSEAVAVSIVSTPEVITLGTVNETKGGLFGAITESEAGEEVSDESPLLSIAIAVKE